MSSGTPWPRVVVDTTTVVSGVLIKRGNPLVLVDAWRRGGFRWLVADAIRDEYGAVLRRPRLLEKYGTSRDDIDDFLRLIAVGAESVVPAPVLPLSVRDANDEPILAAAIGGNADYLVTGDNDLLVLADDPRLGRLRFVTVVEVLALLVL